MSDDSEDTGHDTGIVVPPGRRIDPLGRNMPSPKPPNHGRGATVIAPSRRLAAQIVELEPFTEAAAASYLAKVAMGIDPGAELDERTGKPKPHVPPDWTTRRWAFTEGLARGYGKVKAHVVLEGEVAISGHSKMDEVVTGVTLDAKDLAEIYTPEELKQRNIWRRRELEAAKAKVKALVEAAEAQAAANAKDGNPR